VGDDLLGDATVTVQREWAVGAFDVKMGVAPVAQTGRASSTATHSVVESSGDVATISAETAPGPSLTNEKERAEPVASAEPSRTSCRNVIVAAGDVLDGGGPSVGVAVGRGFDAVAVGLCAGEPRVNAEAEAAVAPGRAPVAEASGDGPGAKPLSGAADPFAVSTSATASPSAVARFAIRRGQLQVRGFKRDRRFVQGGAPTPRSRIAEGIARSARERRPSPTGCSGEIRLASSCAVGVAAVGVASVRVASVGVD
jgi:hypothetical protein